MVKNTIGDEDKYPALKTIRLILDNDTKPQWRRNILRRIKKFHTRIDSIHYNFDVRKATVNTFITVLSLYRDQKKQEMLNSQYPKALREHIACFYDGYTKNIIRKYQRKYNLATWS